MDSRRAEQEGCEASSRWRVSLQNTRSKREVRESEYEWSRAVLLHKRSGRWATAGQLPLALDTRWSLSRASTITSSLVSVRYLSTQRQHT